MKRILILSFSLLGSLLIAGLLIYYYFLPGYAADLILREDTPTYLPGKYRSKIEELKQPIAQYSNDVFKVADSLEINMEFILKAIDNTSSEEVMNVYYMLEHKEVTNSEEVYNLIVENITFHDFDPTHFKNAFLKFATPGRINRLLRYAEKHEFATSIGPDVSKKIAKQLVIKHYKEKEKELKEILNTK